MDKAIQLFIRSIAGTIVLLISFYLMFLAGDYTYKYIRGFTTAELETSSAFKDVQVNIPDGSSTADIAAILKENQLITSAELFRIQSRINKYDGTFKSGTYNLNNKMSDTEIMETLQVAANDISQKRIVVIEGYTLAQIADEIESSGIATAKEFLDECNNGNFDYSFLSDIPLREKKLEGYLFPDTYMFRENATCEEIISRMLSRFQQVYMEEAEKANGAQEKSIDDIIKIASIIEAEVRVPEERARVAGVIDNRLDDEMPLQMCSTVMYALGKKKESLLLADLEIASLYNTYKYKGLPEGPICSPGRAAIAAALNPEKNDYIYFVLKDETSGEHVFTKDYNEFLKAKRDYNQQF